MRRRRLRSGLVRTLLRAPFAVALLAVVVGLALAGCGTTSPDLFLLTRTGSLPGARLTLLVNDGGTVRCNGGAPRQLSDPQLLQARRVQEDVADDASKDLTLPARAGSLLRFRIRTQDGTVTFSDVDAGRRPELGRLIAFTRTIAQDVCGLAR